MSKTITAGLAERLHEADNNEVVEGWTRIAEQHVRTARWLEHYYLVVVDDSGDPWAYWGLPYATGLTEIQEHEYPWQDVPDDRALTLVRLYAHEVKTIEYRTTEPAATA